MNDVTRILSQIELGDPRAAEQLLPAVYNELRRLASQRLSQEKAGQTLQATALVHEAYIRLIEGDQANHWNSRAHFFGAAAEAMRRILVENARRKGRVKHGGELKRVELDESKLTANMRNERLLALDEALERLAKDDAAAAELVKLRFFAGCSIDEAGQILGLPRSTAYELWTYARAWLRCDVDG